MAGRIKNIISMRPTSSAAFPTEQKNDFGVEKTAKSWQKSHEISVRRVLSRTCSGMYEEMATRQTESGVDEKEQTHLLKASFMAARHQKSIQGNGCVACT